MEVVEEHAPEGIIIQNFSSTICSCKDQPDVSPPADPPYPDSVFQGGFFFGGIPLEVGLHFKGICRDWEGGWQRPMKTGREERSTFGCPEVERELWGGREAQVSLEKASKWLGKGGIPTQGDPPPPSSFSSLLFPWDFAPSLCSAGLAHPHPKYWRLL